VVSVAFVPDYSDGLVPDFHRVPFYASVGLHRWADQRIRTEPRSQAGVAPKHIYFFRGPRFKVSPLVVKLSLRPFPRSRGAPICGFFAPGIKRSVQTLKRGKGYTMHSGRTTGWPRGEAKVESGVEEGVVGGVESRKSPESA
jgi:hypothetical protein